LEPIGNVPAIGAFRPYRRGIEYADVLDAAGVGERGFLLCVLATGVVIVGRDDKWSLRQRLKEAFWFAREAVPGPAERKDRKFERIERVDVLLALGPKNSLSVPNPAKVGSVAIVARLLPLPANRHAVSKHSIAVHPFGFGYARLLDLDLLLWR